MNKKVFFGKNDLRFFYYRYKDSSYYSLLIIAVSIIVCVLLIFNIIVPQAEKYFSITREVAMQRRKLDILKKNINFMNNLDKSQLDSQFQTSIQALPVEKDFVAVLNALSDSAIRSGVTIDDFSFNAENVNASSSKLYLDLVIKVNGSIDRIKTFLQKINEELPLAEVVDVNNNHGSTFIGLKFYYNIYPKIAFHEDEPLIPISDADKELLNKLSSWKPTSISIPVEQPVASSSSSPAVPLFD